VITAQELKKIREQIGTGAQNKSAVSVVNKNELERIKKAVIIKDKQQVEEEMRLTNE